MEKSFEEIYDKNIWGGGSGTGSNMTRHNKKYIEMVEGVIKDRDIKTVCDIGCGDWEFSQHIDYGGVSYVGVDCVKSVVEGVQKKYQKNNVRFEHHVVGEGYVPEGYDLVILKDVIQHWTDEDIIGIMDKIIKNNRYVFVTNGYKFMRDQEKNKMKARDISNRYRYHPEDVNKYPLSEFGDYVISTETYFSKQMNLIKYEN